MSSKILKLDRHSVKSLLKETLLTTIKNIATHLSDFLRNHEPESLHQYRVNVRMARSVCLEFSDFMEVKRKSSLEKILKTLQKETNDMRDMDVFLECIEAYKNRLAPSCLKAFQGLERRLKAEKEEAYNAFDAKYTQPFKEALIAQLQTIQSDDLLCLPKSEEKLYKYIKEILSLRLKKIAKASRKLSVNSHPMIAFISSDFTTKSFAITPMPSNSTSFPNVLNPSKPLLETFRTKTAK